MKYQGLTIGPIVKTVQKAESTRGLWASSYIISYLIKKIITELRENGIRDDAFVIPLVSDPRIFDAHRGAGLFPDRVIFKTDNDFNLLKKSIKNAISAFILETKEVIKKEIPIGKLKLSFDADYEKYLNEYFLIYAISKELKDIDNEIEGCNKSLSVLELQQPIQPEQEIDYLSYLFEAINKTDLPKNAGFSTGRFPSIFEISSNELRLINQNEYDEAIDAFLDNDTDGLEYLKEEFKNDFKRRHKYIAIVKADGDNMGKAVEQINKKDKTLVRKVDKLLLDFNIDSIEMIHQFGGKSIYLGGDDILFFAPISFGEKKTVFKLINSLSDSYNKKFTELFEECKTVEENFWKDVIDEEEVIIKQPTLSFGASISYYKYPMFEAIDIANQLLEESKEGVKNAVTFKVTKHSGQSFGSRISKESVTYSEFFMKMLENSIEDSDFLSSVQFQLNQYSHVVEAALVSGKTALENYFKNFFNEPVHGLKEDFLTNICAFLWQAFQDTNDVKIALEIVYSTLRTSQFMNQKDNENEQ